jgi:TIR domain
LELEKLPDGIVFVSYRRADWDRVNPLVEEIKKRFSTFLDRSSLIPGRVWRRGLTEALQLARCVLGLVTENLSDDSYALDEMDYAKSQHVLLPVKLAPGVEIPFGYRSLQCLDLSDWNGGAEGLSGLFFSIQNLLTIHPQEFVLTNTQSLDSSVFYSSNSVAELRTLADQVGTLGGVLAGNAEPIAIMKASLREVHATCAATLEAIDLFLEPLSQQGQNLMTSYFKIPRDLRQMVADKGGHCTRILEYYGRVGGLRDWLQDHAKPNVVKQADETFTRLASADGDIFASITSIAGTLDQEVTHTRELLLRGQEAEARQRLNDAQLKLLPFREELTKFIALFSNAKAELGYIKES